MESKLSTTLDELLELGLGKFTDGVGPKARSTKPHKDFLKIEFDDVEVWDDFTEENADTAFGSFFEVMIPTSEAVKSAQAAVNDEEHSPLICVEEDVSALFANRVQPILNAALQQLRVKMQQAVGIRTSENCRCNSREWFTRVAIQVPARLNGPICSFSPKVSSYTALPP